jgi:uncharacterized protein YndB with AHSA1/START domain
MSTAIDVASHLGAVARVVEDRMQDGKRMRVVVASRAYDTSIDDLWDALTSQERLPRWFAAVDGDLKLGGRFQVKNNAGGTITACVPPTSFSATWEFGGGVSWINLALAPTKAGGTHLTLEHIMEPVGDHWNKFGPGAVGVGWDLSFMGLARHLAEPQAAVAQEAVEGWFGSDEAKHFIRNASDGWGAAAISAGEQRDKALASAESTRQFYTGDAPPPGH